MNRLEVCCDVDGVVADLHTLLCDRLALCGFLKTPHDLKHYDFNLCCSPDEVRIMRAAMASPGFAFNIPWYEGAFDFVQALDKDPLIDLVFVTSPYEHSSTWIEARKTWLEAAGIKRVNVLPITKQWKHRFSGDVLIEDHPGTLREWLDRNPKGFGILFDRPWNRPTANEWPKGFERYERMERAESFEDVQCILTTLKVAKGLYSPPWWAA